MKRLPVDVSNFELMIKGDYLYVDKTQIIHQLITDARLYFLSRPRRFGKSLLISTLKEIYKGNKELFKGLWIAEHSKYDWQQYPVIHLDFSDLAYSTDERFNEDLIFALNQIAAFYKVDISKGFSPSTKLKSLLSELNKFNKVVILIDEYDAPLLNNLDHYSEAYAILKAMKLFFNVIKSSDAQGYIHAIFLTGVTKIAKTSIFSGLNNLNDLTMMPQAAALLGYTHEELTESFKQHIEQFAQTSNLTSSEIINSLKEWYDGYRFSRDPLYVYNPYSIVHCLNQKHLANYWLSTGTPQFLIEVLKKNLDHINEIKTVPVSAEFLGTFDIGELPLEPILYQAGYLTIADYNAVDRKYTLKTPNLEVQESFSKYLVASLINNSERRVETGVSQLKAALEKDDIETFCITLQSLFANIPYNLHIKAESYYHSLLQLLLDLLGYKGHSEVKTSQGIIDLVIETDKRIFIFEFKLDGTAQKALDQINEKRYQEKFLRYKKVIVLIGISFNMKNKKLKVDWKTEKKQLEMDL